MMPYLRCLKLNRGVNVPDCRIYAKEYLQCRMERYVADIYGPMNEQSCDGGPLVVESVNGGHPWMSKAHLSLLQPTPPVHALA